MHASFSSLVNLLREKNQGLNSLQRKSDETAEPPAKRRKADDQDPAQDNVSCSEENNILSQFEKQYSTTDQGCSEINSSLARIINSLLKEKADDEKLSDIRKRYGKPKNCDRLPKQRLILKFGIIFQREQEQRISSSKRHKSRW